MRKKKELILGGTKVEVRYDSTQPIVRVEEIIRKSFEKVGRLFRFSTRRPEIIVFELMYSRQEYNKRLNRETQNWESAHAENGVITIFDPEALEKYSSHSRNEFPAIVVHELTHIFTHAVNKPTLDWVNEGLAQYVAGQDNGRAIEQEKLGYFLNHHFVKNIGYRDFIDHGGYRISFVLVGYLVKNFGETVIESLIALPGNTDCTKQIEGIFGTPIETAKNNLRHTASSIAKG